MRIFCRLATWWVCAPSYAEGTAAGGSSFWSDTDPSWLPFSPLFLHIDTLVYAISQDCQKNQGPNALERLVACARHFTESLEPAAQTSGVRPTLSR